MADDISKKITIEIEAETDEVKKNIADLNQTFDGLLQRQKQMADNGKDATKSLQDFAAQIKTIKSALDGQTKAVEDSSKAIIAHKASLAQNRDAMDALLQKYDAVSRAQGDHSKNAKDLNFQIGTLSNTIADQDEKLKKSRQVFDAHKETVKALSNSFDKLKGVSGMFGPSLKEAAEGFETLKSGLEIVKTGFNSVGDAIKTTGFGLLVLVLQSVVQYFTKTTEGSAKLKGAISAVGIIVEKVNHVFQQLGKFIVDAVSHPIESIKSLGNVIWDNIVNRFKAFSVILDGIIHLDFKKMSDGAIQAFTGVTNATSKITTAFNTVKKGAEETAGEMVKAYEQGYKKAGEQVKKHELKVKESFKRQAGYYNNFNNSITNTNNNGDKTAATTDSQRKDPLTAESSSITDLSTGNPAASAPQLIIKQEQQTADTVLKIKKTALDKAEEYAKKNAITAATDALKTLSNGIKQASDAKVAALEKDKAAELSNTSLTSAQKLAINQKYKKEEDKIKAKAFKEQQEISIMQALINGAIAITKAPADLGPIAGAIAVAAIIASTAAQVATIAKQKPPMAKGGYFKSDGKGAVLPGYSRTDDTNAYLRSGEAVVVSEAMQVPWARNLVSAINVGFGGRDFSMPGTSKGYAVGGIFTDGGDANRYYNQPVNDQKNLANTIAYQMINNFPPVYVDVKDVNNQQNILAQTINRVNL